MKIIDWRVCSQCMEACEYCFADTGYRRVNSEEENTILKKIIASEIECVNITGGEPMLETDRCLKLIDNLWKAGKKVYLSSNGHHIEEHFMYLKERVSLLGLPLDGYDEVTNMICGRSKSSFSTVIDILKNPIAQKVKIKIGTVITKKNLTENNLETLSQLLDKLPVDIWRIYEVLPENRGEKNRNMLILDKADRQELYRYIQQISGHNHSYRVELVTREMRNSNYLIIQPDGGVMVPLDAGKQVYEFQLGNLIELPLQEIINRWKDITCGHIEGTYSEQRLRDAVPSTKEEM